MRADRRSTYYRNTQPSFILVWGCCCTPHARPRDLVLREKGFPSSSTSISCSLSPHKVVLIVNGRAIYPCAQSLGELTSSRSLNLLASRTLNRVRVSVGLFIAEGSKQYATWVAVYRRRIEAMRKALSIIQLVILQGNW